MLYKHVFSTSVYICTSYVGKVINLYEHVSFCTCTSSVNNMMYDHVKVSNYTIACKKSNMLYNHVMDHMSISVWWNLGDYRHLKPTCYRRLITGSPKSAFPLKPTSCARTTFSVVSSFIRTDNRSEQVVNLFRTADDCSEQAVCSFRTTILITTLKRLWPDDRSE